MQSTTFPIERLVGITPDQSLNDIDKTLNSIQLTLDTISNTLQGKDLYIIGGSACCILDHLYHNKALIFRDLDLAIVMDKCTTTLETQAIAEELKSKIPNVERIDSLEDRSRTPKGVPLHANSLFCSGKGFFLFRSCDWLKLLDITLYDHIQDLEELNGVFNQDSISIVLNQKRTFSQFITEARKKSVENLISDGWIRQPENAYQDWTKGGLIIRNWEDISRRPSMLALRIVRSLNKKGLLEHLFTGLEIGSDLQMHLNNSNLEIPRMRSDLQKQWKDLNQAIASNSFIDFHLQSRLFERSLKDTGCAMELKALSNVGVFNTWLPFLKKAISWMSVEEIDELLTNSQNSPEDKLLSLMRESPLEEQLHTLFFAFGGPDTIVNSSKVVWEQIKNAFSELGGVNMSACEQLIKERCESDREKYAKCFSRIVSSTCLNVNEKCQLFLRLLVSNEKDLFFLFPNASAKNLECYWKNLIKPRIGFFTGVFDPITNTHVQIVAFAIEQMHLDQVIVAPVYLCNKINRPTLEWKDRRSMVKIGLEKIPEAEVIAEELFSELSKSIGITFNLLRVKVDAAWVHISGSDAFERFKQLNLLDHYHKQNIRIFVVQRVGAYATTPPQKYATLISYFNPEIPLGISGMISARDVRQMVIGGRDIKEFVPEKIQEYIKAHNFYSPLPPMQMPWQILAPEQYHEIIKQQLPYANLRSDLNHSVVAKDTMNNLLDRGLPGLLLQIENIDHKQHLVKLTYQQSKKNLPKIIQTECESHLTLPTVSHLIQKLIHELIGHT